MAKKTKTKTSKTLLVNTRKKYLATEKLFVPTVYKNKVNRTSVILHTLFKETTGKGNKTWLSAAILHSMILRDGLDINKYTIDTVLRDKSGLRANVTPKGVVYYHDTLLTKVVNGVRLYKYNTKGTHNGGGVMNKVSYDNINTARLVK